MDIAFLCSLDYDSLKNRLLLMNEEELRLVLSEYKIKDKLINSPTRHDFIWLSQEKNKYIIPLLLDDVGIDILANTDEMIEKMNGILTSENSYVEELFENVKFLEIIKNNFDKLKYCFSSINGKSAKRLIEHIPSNVIEIIGNLNSEATNELVKIYNIDGDILKNILSILPAKAVEYLLDNDYRITTLSDIDYNRLFYIFMKGIVVPRNLLDDKDFVNKLSMIHDPKDYRFLIEELKKNNDTENIESKRKEYYEKEINSFNRENNMLDRYYNLYRELVKLIDSRNFDYNEVKMLINKYLVSISNDKFCNTFIKNIWDYRNDKEGLRLFFEEESNYMLTNMIIDYHFEDVYYNFLIDLKQLYNFQKTEGRTLSDKDIVIYEKILNLDNLSYDEKLLLFDELKKNNMIEKYYDDFREAKNKSSSLIKEQMINFDNVDQYKNNELSNKYGVNVYVLDGQPFYAFVKSFTTDKKYILNSLQGSYVDASSYSLDGSDKLDTFKNPKEYYNIMYGDFNIDQVVHMFSVDSFSGYRRASDYKATDRIYELYTPSDFVKRSFNYNEIIYSQKNDRFNDDLNNRLDRPKELAIYCYDEITENDIESAKRLGIGIMLVKTKSYNIDLFEDRIGMYDTTSSFGVENKYTYINKPEDNAMIGRRK